MLREVSKTGDISAWLHDRAADFDSPIYQIFLRPFGQPTVVLSDFREAQDICMRRKEFDRGQSLKDLFRGSSPNHHITLSTDDKWKAHRRLLQDLMSPPFLRDVAAPEIYTNVLNLVSLWNEKTRVADGRPFDADLDIHYAALDAVTAFSFGKNFSHNATKPVADLIRRLTPKEVARMSETASVDDPIEFPSVQYDEVVAAILCVTTAIEKLHGSPWPVWKWKFIERLPPLNRNMRVKNDFIVEELENATARLQVYGDDESWVRSAVDLMVQRERKLAHDERREPDFLSPIMKEELFGVIIGGHDTTSTTMLWGLKLLADHPLLQSKLRAAMERENCEATNEARNLTIKEIMHNKVPYLDATMEEILRCAGTAPLVERQALCDTILLGRHIPQGTKVFCLSQGASMKKPAYRIDEMSRNETCRLSVKNRGRVPEWDPEDIAEFKPERWLTATVPSEKPQINGVKLESADQEFDSSAGPQLAFGLGKRGCFGRRLAYVELRIILSLLVWNFEILKCPEALSGYEGKDGVTYRPIKNFVRLKKVQR
ncbi:Beta-amyrin 11-oxidase [Colletotrichum chlorophyti]|uniref:Beta-amyrin 11-oxidase n=1 Tax=Colletotrichum chlorophyti TaxID=708187 RepID=A0A1Q8RAE0_9PEZI|nr:Beta-amyrin 11-oxidase [Colletotrichum chlorophyti]